MKETSRAKQAYEDYYALGPIRSIRKLYRAYSNDAPNSPTTSPHTLKRWSATFHWPERVRDREEIASQKTQERVTDAVAVMRARQAKLGQQLQDKGIKRLLELEDGEISTRDAIAMIVEGAKLERQARGENIPALDISVLLAETTRSINIIALSENIFKKALEERGAIQNGEKEEDGSEGAVSVPDPISER